MANKQSIDFKIENDLVTFSCDENELVEKVINFVQANIDAAFGDETHVEVSLMELSFGLQIIRKRLGIDNTDDLKQKIKQEG